VAAIWEDMRDNYEEAPISQKAVDLLKERQHRLTVAKPNFSIGTK
jgi:hypothetical protein